MRVFTHWIFLDIICSEKRIVNFSFPVNRQYVKSIFT